MVFLELFVGFLMDFHDSLMIFLEFSHFPMMVLPKTLIKKSLIKKLRGSKPILGAIFLFGK